MPTWLIVALWIIWFLFAVRQFVVLKTLWDRNTNDFQVIRHGRLHLKRWGYINLFLFLTATVFWFCWNIFG